ncbi:transporter substrate-binding domain-containing protein [Treponema primitia]|uniref:transporter substrate-binding domain-containing protein n=1 Tax=Treponema primitia TaxID=88058 RepID=UPI00025553C7|nr:transporter substrate-binding domain-containing protein [Treponema primitia]
MKKAAFMFLITICVVFSGFANGGRDPAAPFNDHDIEAVHRIHYNGEVRIGIPDDEPPIAYTDANGLYQGYDAYFAKRIGKELLDKESLIRFVPVEAARRAEYLDNGRVDFIIANFAVSPENAAAVDFALPYRRAATGIVSPDSASVTELAQLEGKTLILVRGTPEELWVGEQYPHINLLQFDRFTEAASALLDGRGAALIHDSAVVLAWTKEHRGYSAAVESAGPVYTIAPAVRKGNDGLILWLNDVISRRVEADFFHKAYEATLRPVYGAAGNPETVVIERGIIQPDRNQPYQY